MGDKQQTTEKKQKKGGCREPPKYLMMRQIGLSEERIAVIGCGNVGFLNAA